MKRYREILIDTRRYVIFIIDSIKKENNPKDNKAVETLQLLFITHI